jgi:hypothetical protein
MKGKTTLARRLFLEGHIPSSQRKRTGTKEKATAW